MGPLHESTESQEAQRSDKEALALQHSNDSLKSMEEETQRLLKETYAFLSAMLQRTGRCTEV